jgi:hypothetical protein
MYIVCIYIGNQTVYFSGEYIRGVYSAAEVLSKKLATQLSAEQADDVGCYYARLYNYSYTIERI